MFRDGVVVEVDDLFFECGVVGVYGLRSSVVFGISVLLFFGWGVGDDGSSIFVWCERCIFIKVDGVGSVDDVVIVSWGFGYGKVEVDIIIGCYIGDMYVKRLRSVFSDVVKCEWYVFFVFNLIFVISGLEFN